MTIDTGEPRYQLFQTADGSMSVRDGRYGVPFHSIHGAITESLHVFIEAGLAHAAHQHNNLRVLEVGFGSGLNALLTALWAGDHETHVDYTGIEPDPLPGNLIEQLAYPGVLRTPALQDTLQRMHENNGKEQFNDWLSFDLYRDPLQSLSGTPRFNLVYYDAFAPGAQPEMWSPGILRHLTRLLLPGAVLVTYCAKGQFKRDLKSLGFKVESLPGPPGKREMVRATLRGA